MRFVKKEHQFGFVGVADFGQLLEQLREHPQQKRGVQARRVHQFVGRQDVDHAVAIAIGLHEVVDVEHGLAKEFVAALLLDLHQATLDGPNAGGADIAVLGGEFFGVVAHILQHGPQVFQVEQQHAAVVGDFEHQVQHTFLGVVQIEHAPQEQRAHVADGGANRVALLAKHIPQGGGAGRKSGCVQTALFQDGGHFVAQLAGLAQARQVAFDVGHEHRHADAREALRHGLQGDGFARTGGTGDQAVAVGQLGQ